MTAIGPIDTSQLSGGADGQILTRTAGVWTPTDDAVSLLPAINNSMLLGSTSGTAQWYEQPFPTRAGRRGFLGWSFDPLFHGTAAAPTAGVVRLNSIYLEAMGTFSKVTVWMQGGSPSLTANQCFAAVYRRSTGNNATLIALSADTSTSFASQPLGVDIPVTAQGGNSLAVNPGDILYGALLFNGTPGTMMVQSGSAQAAETNAFVTSPDIIAGAYSSSITSFGSLTTIDLTVATQAPTVQFMGLK